MILIEQYTLQNPLVEIWRYNTEVEYDNIKK